MGEDIKKYEQFIDIILTVPRAFHQDWFKDRFEDSLKRVLYDSRSLNYKGVSGLYDHEILAMLICVFRNSNISGSYKLLVDSSVSKNEILSVLNECTPEKEGKLNGAD